MLREVKNKHIKPRIMPFQVTTASGGSTLNIGYGDFTATRTAAGAGVLTARQGVTRKGMFFGTQGLTVGSYVCPVAATAQTVDFSFTLLNEAGTGTDGSFDGFVFGWDSSDVALTKQQRVACTQNSPRVIWGKVTGSTGAVAIGASDFACTRTTTGTYSITFKKAFGQTPVVMVTGSGNTSTTVANAPLIASKTAGGVTVTMADESPAAADGDFYILAIGSDSRSDAARGRMPLQNSQRKPRIVAAQITMAAGTPSISTGGATGGVDIASLVDNGTGDFSFTISETFIREPAIFVASTTQRAEIHSYAANVVRVKTKAANGNDTDVNGITNVFIIGSDDASEY